MTLDLCRSEPDFSNQSDINICIAVEAGMLYLEGSV
jgi:hypothetical protein